MKGLTMNHNSQVSVFIAGVSIRQDAEGRYCLNDLHDAAVKNGAVKRTTEPASFLRSPQTIELVRQLETTLISRSLSPVSKTEGRNGGTFVVLELVYAYAMWISPSFYLDVINTYHAVATGNITLESLPPAILTQIGGVIKSVVIKQVGEMVKLQHNLRYGHRFDTGGRSPA
jgi:hypothetical protein